VLNPEESRDKLGTILQPEADPGTAFDPKALLQLLRDKRALVPKIEVGVRAFAPVQSNFGTLILH